MTNQLARNFRNPTKRRMWVTVISGALILSALVAKYALSLDALWAALMITAAVLGGVELATRALKNLRFSGLSIELLVTIAAGGALLIGEHWEAAAVTFLFNLGAWLEMRTMRKTRSSLKELLDAAPATAVVLRDGQAVESPVEQVQPGETVLVKAGERVPVDGEVVKGSAAVSEATITGESIPAEKSRGSRVHAGTIAENGLLHIRATARGADTTLAKIIQRVEKAQEEKAPTQRVIERFARWYTPAILVLAAVAFAITGNVRLALTLLVVSCPGALVISTPVSVVAGIGRAARAGILIKGGQHLEKAGRITAIAFDKTGTLTEGAPRLSAVIPLGGMKPEEVIRWAAIAEQGSRHPLARPIVDEALLKGSPLPPLQELEEVPGMGLIARIDGREIAVGNRRLLARQGIPINKEAMARLDELMEDAHTPVLVALDGKLVGIVALADRVRSTARSMIERLRAVGLQRVLMLTGDQAKAAGVIAAKVGIDEVHAGLLPDQKLEHIEGLSADGFQVAMVGDGINDAPALAAADTSIAMGAAGSDVAIETADIALMSDDLGKINEAVEISRATLRNMRQNLAIALMTVAVLIIGVLTGRVHMAGGMLVHQLSVLVVVANGMRLMRKPKQRALKQQFRRKLQSLWGSSVEPTVCQECGVAL